MGSQAIQKLPVAQLWLKGFRWSRLPYLLAGSLTCSQTNFNCSWTHPTLSGAFPTKPCTVLSAGKPFDQITSGAILLVNLFSYPSQQPPKSTLRQQLPSLLPFPPPCL